LIFNELHVGRVALLVLISECHCQSIASPSKEKKMFILDYNVKHENDEE